MAGLVPAIHVLATSKEGVDARDKRGHNGVWGYHAQTSLRLILRCEPRLAASLEGWAESILRDASLARLFFRAKIK